MEHTKKMTLVPEELARAVQASIGSGQPTRRVLSKLDESIQSILESDNVSDKDKVVLYHEALQKFLQLHQNEARPSTIHLKVTEQPSPDTSSVDEVQQKKIDQTSSMKQRVLKMLPVTLKNKATLLMDHVLQQQEDAGWGWNTRGELIYNGRTVNGSNVIDLMYDVLKDRKTAKPIGWQYFLHVLRNANVPESLVMNKDRRELLQQIKLDGNGATKSPRLLPHSPPIITTKTKTPLRAPSTKKTKKPSLRWEPY